MLHVGFPHAAFSAFVHHGGQSMSGKNFTAVLLLLGSGLMALPAWGVGQLSMSGAIVATACDIDTASRDQTINMGTFTVEQITQDSSATTRPFGLRLMKCVLEYHNGRRLNGQHFRVTFSGRSEGEYFGLDDEGRGVVLVLTDSQGRTVTPDKPLPPQMLQPGETTLHYGVALKSLNSSVQSGAYTALVRYHLDYY